MARIRYVILILMAALSGCGGGGVDPPLTAEAFCAQRADSYGHFFYCGTVQGNLQFDVFPDGAHGYCANAVANLGLVGYSAYTSNGSATPVNTQAYASGAVQNAGYSGYITCTRQ